MHRQTTVDVGGEPLRLHAERAAFRPRTATLYLADPHFGKAATFRHAGIPVPAGGTAHDLTRLSRLIEHFAPRRLVILGDFFHAAAGRDPALLQQLTDWRRDHRHLAVELIRGNHDAHAGDPPANLTIAAFDAPRDDAGFTLLHDPTSLSPAPVDPAPPDRHPFALAGHLHPAIHLSERGRGGARLPCFWFTPRVAVLPAFGSFTGTHTVRPQPDDRLIAVTPDGLLHVPTAVLI